jgi:hypothetical protein
MPANRRQQANKGSFQKGQSGNPSGRPKDVGPIKELAKQHTEAAINALVGALADDNGRTRVAAAEAILDRAYGRPSQHLELDAGDELVRRMNEAAKRLNGVG